MPSTVFIYAEVNGRNNVLVISEVATPWIDLGNPGNEDEALHLLAQNTPLRDTLRRFIQTAQECFSEDKIIDLFGENNLVITTNRKIKYIDSFEVFFYNLSHILPKSDPELEKKIAISLKKRKYLEELLEKSELLYSKKAKLKNFTFLVIL